MRTYTISEAAEATGLSRKALARRIERGSLRSVVRNGRRRIPRSELVRAGLLEDPNAVRVDEFDPRALLPRPLPADDPDAPPLRPDETLAALFRELLDRFERQAAEIAQFRALTVQAESLRMTQELADLRVRLAELEQEPRNALTHGTGELTERVTELSQRVEDLSKREIWLPPRAQARTRTAAQAGPASGTPDPEVLALMQRMRQLEQRPARSGPRLGRGLRLLVEATVIVGVALASWRLDLPVTAIAAAMAVTWIAVALVEWASWRRGG